MQFTVEAWDPDYGTGGDSDGLDPSTDVVDPTIEHAPDDWRPIDPVAHDPGTIYFVDGVRRIDARIWVTDEHGRVLPGSCATVAAGSVACTPTSATIHDIALRRIVLTPPTASAASIATEFGDYEHVEITTGSPEDLYLGIHEEMTRLETETIPDIDRDGLVVFDGPLRGRSSDRSIGIIKTQHVQYLEGHPLTVVATLEAGQRTPLFQIGSGRFARLAWYLRLPGPRTHGWAGILRCEIPRAELTDAVSITNQVSAALPRFASEPHKEQRAPQNLYPIAGLERALRARLGDQRLLQRALRRAASSVATPTP